MKREAHLSASSLVMAFLLIAANSIPIAAQASKNTYVKAGSKAPEFSGRTTDGQTVSLANLKGKVVWVNFFATWCPPCRRELPHLDTDIWQKYKDQGLVVLAVGRGHEAEELRKLKESEKLSLTVIADPDQRIFGMFAKNTIPRNYLIGKDGKVAFEESGFREKDIPKMIRSVEKALARPD